MITYAQLLYIALTAASVVLLLMALHFICDQCYPRRYRHRCPDCDYLGRLVYGGQRYDLYHCRESGRVPTVFARYGDGADDYLSWDPGPSLPDHPVRVALDRAAQRTSHV